MKTILMNKVRQHAVFLTLFLAHFNLGTSRMEKSLAIMSRMAAGEVIILGNRLRFTEYLVAFAPLLALRYRHLISMYDQPCRPTTTLF